MGGNISMSLKEIERIRIINRVLEKQLKQREAAQLMRLSYRQTKRIISKVKKAGLSKIAHQSRGRASGRQINSGVVQQIIGHFKEHYYDFGPTLAQEKMQECQGIKISRESLRQILIKNGLWYAKKKSEKSVHVWRERKEHWGEMIQIDGSHHCWLAGHAPFCLMGYIDDATGDIFGKFHTYEGTMPILDSFGDFVRKNGIPHSVYIDRHSTYKVNQKTSIQEDLLGEDPKSQFEMVMQDLGVKVIHARSPQAKGRIERLFGTLQDRLVKELRLAGVKTLQEANDFLVDYLDGYNRRFSVVAKSKQSFFKEVATNFDYQWTFAIRAWRTIGNDYTIRYEKRLFALQNPRLAVKGERIMIKQDLTGKLLFLSKFGVLATQDISHKVAKSACHSTYFSANPLADFVAPKMAVSTKKEPSKNYNKGWTSNAFKVKHKPAVFCH